MADADERAARRAYAESRFNPPYPPTDENRTAGIRLADRVGDMAGTLFGGAMLRRTPIPYASAAEMRRDLRTGTALGLGLSAGWGHFLGMDDTDEPQAEASSLNRSPGGYAAASTLRPGAVSAESEDVRMAQAIEEYFAHFDPASLAQPQRSQMPLVTEEGIPFEEVMPAPHPERATALEPNMRPNDWQSQLGYHDRDSPPPWLKPMAAAAFGAGIGSTLGTNGPYVGTPVRGPVGALTGAAALGSLEAGYPIPGFNIRREDYERQFGPYSAMGR